MSPNFQASHFRLVVSSKDNFFFPQRTGREIRQNAGPRHPAWHRRGRGEEGGGGVIE